MKKLLSLLLAVMMLSGCFTSFAEEAIWEYDKFACDLSANDDIVLQGDIAVPAEYEGNQISRIGFNGFYDQNEITSITLPDTIQLLGYSALCSNAALTSLTLSQNLTVMKANNIYKMPLLTEVTIPASVAYMENCVYLLDSLKSVTFEGMCPTFAGSCFGMLPEDFVVYVPDDQIDAYKAALDEHWVDVSKVQPSGKNAVVYDHTAPEADFTFDAASGTITGYSGNAAYLVIPSTIGGAAVKAIGEGVFMENPYLSIVDIPEGIEVIGKNAFYNNPDICQVFLPDSVRVIGEGAFYNCDFNEIILGASLEEIGAQAFAKAYLREIELPESVRVIGDGAFEGNPWLYEVIIHGNVEKIGSRAFANTDITYMAFDFYSMIDIAADAFADISNESADLDLPWDSSVENWEEWTAYFAEAYPACYVWINNPAASGIVDYPSNNTEITTITDGVWTAYNGDQENLSVWCGYDEIRVTTL